MLTAMLLAIFYIPLFFVIVRRTTRDVLLKLHARDWRAPRPPEAKRYEDTKRRLDARRAARQRLLHGAQI